MPSDSPIIRTTILETYMAIENSNHGATSASSTMTRRDKPCSYRTRQVTSGIWFMFIRWSWSQRFRLQICMLNLKRGRQLMRWLLSMFQRALALAGLQPVILRFSRYISGNASHTVLDCIQAKAYARNIHGKTRQTSKNLRCEGLYRRHLRSWVAPSAFYLFNKQTPSFPGTLGLHNTQLHADGGRRIAPARTHLQWVSVSSIYHV